MKSTYELHFSAEGNAKTVNGNMCMIAAFFRFGRSGLKFIGKKQT